MSHWTDAGRFVREPGDMFTINNGTIYLVVVIADDATCNLCYWSEQGTMSCARSYRSEVAGACTADYREDNVSVNFKRVEIDRNRED